jgi:hypothetical protein
LFVRLIAALPMLAAAISMVVFLAMAFDNAWWILLAIGDFWAFMRLAQDYEWTVRDVAAFFRRMSDDAMYE